jgi:hypothetical protein
MPKFAIIDWSVGGFLLREGEDNVRLFNSEAEASDLAKTVIGLSDVFQVIQVPDNIVFFISSHRPEDESESLT